MPSLQSDSSFGDTSHGSRHGKGRKKGKLAKNLRNKRRAQGKSYRTATTINMLPDDVLFNILDLYQMRSYCVGFASWEWHVLCRVCRRWEQIIFSHPHSLNVKLYLEPGTPVRKRLDRWPASLVDVGYVTDASLSPCDEDGIYASFENPNRVCSVTLKLPGPLLAKMTTAMQKPFPALRSLILWPYDSDLPALPDGFLAGSAPRLEELYLHSIPFPALKTLLSSASDLVGLELLNIPKTSYISPEALVACLAIMHKLNYLTIEFHWATSHPGPLLLPETRLLLDYMQVFEFTGSSAYFEDLGARLDTPQLKKFSIHYLDPPNFPQLFKFIDRLNCKILQSSPSENAGVCFDFLACDLHPPAFRDEDRLEGSYFMLDNVISLYIPGDGLKQQLSQMTQILCYISAMLADVVDLRITAHPPKSNHQDQANIDEIALLELLRPFTAMKTLRVGEGLWRIAPALEGITRRMGIQLLPHGH